MRETEAQLTNKEENRKQTTFSITIIDLHKEADVKLNNEKTI